MTASSDPPRPRKQSKLLDKLTTFAKGISRDPQRYNISDFDAMLIQKRIDAYAKAYLPGSAKGIKSRSTVRAKNNARSEAEKIHSKFYNQIKNDPRISDDDKISIGVKPVNLKRTKIRVPGRAPRIKAMCATEGQHTLRFTDAISLECLQGKGIKGDPGGGGREGAKGKPRGAAFIQLYAAVGPGKKQPLSDAREIGLFTKNPIIIEHKEPDNGKQAVYWARWISPTGKASRWSEPTSMAIAA